jgi:hypothetical protein
VSRTFASGEDRAALSIADVAEMLKCLPQALKALKTAGVPDAVILAMVQA